MRLEKARWIELKRAADRGDSRALETLENEVVEAVEREGSLTAATQSVGIGYHTVYAWLQPGRTLDRVGEILRNAGLLASYSKH